MGETTKTECLEEWKKRFQELQYSKKEITKQDGDLKVIYDLTRLVAIHGKLPRIRTIKKYRAMSMVWCLGLQPHNLELMLYIEPYSESRILRLQRDWLSQRVEEWWWNKEPHLDVCFGFAFFQSFSQSKWSLYSVSLRRQQTFCLSLLFRFVGKIVL